MVVVIVLAVPVEGLFLAIVLIAILISIADASQVLDVGMGIRRAFVAFRSLKRKGPKACRHW